MDSTFLLVFLGSADVKKERARREFLVTCVLRFLPVASYSLTNGHEISSPRILSLISFFTAIPSARFFINFKLFFHSAFPFCSLRFESFHSFVLRLLSSHDLYSHAVAVSFILPNNERGDDVDIH